MRTAFIARRGPARVFTTEHAAIAAIKARRAFEAGDIMVLMCRGPMGSGMEETYQLTSALKHLDFGKHVARHHRCPLQRRLHRRLHRPCLSRSAGRRARSAKSADGDILEIVVDRKTMVGTVNLVGTGGSKFEAPTGARVSCRRGPRVRILRQTPRFPPTPVSGRRCRT